MRLALSGDKVQRNAGREVVMKKILILALIAIVLILTVIRDILKR